MDTLVSAEDEKNMNTSRIAQSQLHIAPVFENATHIVRVKTPNATPSEKLEGGTRRAYRKGV